MAVNARTEKFQHLEVFDKPALFTNGRIARDTVPKGWYCYDMRGSDDDPGELCYMEENVVVNHAGSVLMPEKLAMPKSGRLDVRDELGFLDEGNMTLREFCETHQLPYLEAIDVMLELTENTPIFYSQDRLLEPCLLRFGGDGEMLGLLFSVTWLDIPGRIAAAPRMKGERIIWITDCVDMGSINLPKHHFFAHRQQDGTHRFYGSSESERNQDQEVN